MTDLSPDDFDDPVSYAVAVQGEAVADVTDFDWAVGGGENFPVADFEYGIEPGRGADARCVTFELASVIEDLPSFRDGARIVRRTVSSSCWEYVTPQEITNA